MKWDIGIDLYTLLILYIKEIITTYFIGYITQRMLRNVLQ